MIIQPPNTNLLINADCLTALKELPDNSVDSIVTDPPYGLSFMGKKWDYDVPSVEVWKECLRVLKPGAFLLSFAGTRTYHRMAVNIEDAGFEIRDMISWLYGCLSEDTEILTCGGWKKYNKIVKGESVYSFNLVKNQIEKSKVDDIFIYEHNGKMICLKNDNTDQLLTLNHKVILKEGYRKQNNYSRKWYHPKNWSWNYANQIKNYGIYNLPLGSIYNGNLSLGVDFSELLGWILSEGNFQKDTNAINIYQSSINKEKVDMIRDLLNRLKIKHSEYKRNRVYKERKYIEHQFYFSGNIIDKIKKIIPNKKPTSDLLNLKYVEKVALFNSLMLGDGSKHNGKKYTVFYQKDIKFLEWFQILCHLIGKQARINKKKWAVEVHHNPTTQLQARHLKNRVIDYIGKVWSIKTHNMSYIARRNGKIFITGNSGFPKSLNIGKQVDKIQGNEREVVGKKIVKGGENLNKLSRENKNDNINAKGCGAYGKGAKQINIEINDTKGNSEWEGWGTALKPACEPIVVARKPLSEKNVALNVLRWGTGGINIDECRISHNEPEKFTDRTPRVEDNVFSDDTCGFKKETNHIASASQQGRFPANIILNKEAGRILDEQSGISKSVARPPRKATNENQNTYSSKGFGQQTGLEHNDKGGASRFFYCAKASKSERNLGCEELETVQMDWSDRIKNGDGKFMGTETKSKGEPNMKNNHPTVKPLKLMQYLVRLVTKKGGIVLDPFGGSGTTGIACIKEEINYILIEKDKDYCKIAKARIKVVEDSHKN